MGIHIINVENGKLRHDYVDTIEELSYVEFITKDSIIYKGEESRKPTRISESKEFNNFSKGWFRAGIQAQETFKDQATKAGFILEELSQDQKSFKSYTTNAKNISIKRGDFLVRNFGNIEIDVKCRGFRIFNGEQHFDFKVEDVTKHLNMQKFTKTPILIAVYENIRDRPFKDKVYFFAIDALVKSKEIATHFREGIGDCYRIPLSFTEEGFGLIRKIYKSLISTDEEIYVVSEDEAEYAKSYESWTKEDNEKLELLFSKGYTIKELSVEFEMKNEAIRDRINELELREKYER